MRALTEEELYGYKIAYEDMITFCKDKVNILNTRLKELEKLEEGGRG